MSIKQDSIERVRDRASAVEVIGEYTALKRVGRGFKGLCPFHEEKTPSFSVNEEEGFFHCFGCGKKGSVIDFVMDKKGLTFPEAIRYLANRFGVSIEQESKWPDGSPGAASNSSSAKEEKTRLSLVLEFATSVYEQQLLELPAHSPIREYLQARRIKPETIATFRLGWAPESWSFLRTRFGDFADRVQALMELSDQRLQEELLVKSGLTKAREDGTSYDVFRGRLIFPICRSDGKPIALGGRLINDKASGPKYLNSPESIIYAKRKTLFGVNNALAQISKTSTVFLVEGYMDVLSMHQVGLANVLATCGTAFTAEHVGVIKRFAKKVVVLFDGDSAGRRAAQSVFPTSINSGMDFLVCQLPEGEDPDSLAAAGRNELDRVLASASSAYDWFLDQLLLAGNDDGQEVLPSAVARAASDVAQILSRVANPVERELLIKRGSERMGITCDSLLKLVADFVKRKDSRPVYDSARQTRSSVGPSPSAVLPGPPATLNAEAEASASWVANPWNQTPEAAGVVVKSSPTSERVNPRKRGQRLDSIEELLCAVLREPALATSLVANEFKQGLSELLPENIRSFLLALTEDEYVGLEFASWNNIHSPPPLSIKPLLRLMKHHFLPVERLVHEAIQQIRTGGSEPKRVVKQIQMRLERRLIRGELLDIARAMQPEGDEAESLRLAQEKLRQRKKLESLK